MIGVLSGSCQSREKDVHKKNVDNSEYRSDGIKTLSSQRKPLYRKPREVKARFPFFDGITTIPDMKSGDVVWGPVPLSDGWDIVNYGICRILSIKESMVLCNAGNLNFRVPSSILIKITNPGKKIKGKLVLASLGLSSEWGIVKKYKKSESTLNLLIGVNDVEKVIPNNYIRIFENMKAVPGYPLFYKYAGKWNTGSIIMVSDQTYTVIGFGGQLVNVKIHDTKLFDFNTVIKPKSWVWAPFMDQLEEGRVISVMPSGTSYLIDFTGRSHKEGINPRPVRIVKVSRPFG